MGAHLISFGQFDSAPPGNSQRKFEMQYRRSLPPAVLCQERPQGLARGGVLAADWVPATYMSMARPTVPSNSPAAHNVAQDVFRSPVAFASPDQPRRIGGPGQMVRFADQAPLPVCSARSVATAHGMTEGGVFGPGSYMNGFAFPVVPAVPTMKYALAGCGAGPDGIGGCR